MNLSIKETRLWIAKHLAPDHFKQNPMAHLGVLPGRDDEQQPQHDIGSHLLVYIVDVWAYAAIRAIAEAVSDVPLLVQSLQTVNSELTWVTQTDGDLFDLINFPNHDEPMTELTKRTIMSLMASGNAYQIHDPVDGELYYVKPDWIKAVVTKDGRLAGYRATNNALTYNAEVDEIVHFRLADPTGDYYGMPPSKVIKKAIMTKLSLNTYINEFFNNNAMLGLSLTTEQSLSPDQRTIIRKEMDRIHKGVKNAGKTAILEGGLSLDKLAPNLKDLIPVEVNDIIREETLAAYGVPPVIVGVLKDASYSNAQAQKKLFYENRVLPTIKTMESYYNLQLVPRFGENLRLWFDRNAMQPLQEDQNAMGVRLVGYVKGGILTPNEVRQDIGYEPIDGGDELMAAGGSMGGLFGTDADESRGFVLPVMPPQAGMISAVKAATPRVRFWNAHYKAVTASERAMIKLIKKFFDGQLDRVMDNLGDISVGGKMSPAALHSWILSFRLRQLQTKGASDDADELFDIAVENLILREATESFVKEVIRQSGQQAIDRVGVSATFSLNNPYVVDMMNSFQNRLSDINDTSYQVIKDVLEQAYEDGDSLGKIERSLRGKFKDFSKVRSKRIALTEMNGMVNGASRVGYGIAGIEKQEWSSAFLSTSRPEHTDADGQVVGITELFMVGGEQLAFPGDPAGSPGNVINCYCAIMPVVE